ncbi:hypothetical protein NW762_012131 [Fusarium torreyae]|uniref:Uncharacterized protein n=1 Tax=Fusarium torreyae TaxID=1237075 RepID=A0A9W8RN32_9HYPO|nr:hypothetical protein NW762_012131 [Fusarium torreyae]
MHVHLLNCKSTNSLVQRLGFNKLELCMTVMRELQKTYTSASMFCGIFGEVQRFLKKSSMDQHRSAMLEAENVNVGQPHSLGSGGSAEPVDIDPALMDDNLFNSLLDEQSGFNLWESMGMMELPFDTFFDPAQHTFGS